MAAVTVSSNVHDNLVEVPSGEIKVVRGGKIPVNDLVPFHQSTKVEGQTRFLTLSAQNPSASVFTKKSKFEIDIDPKDLLKIKSVDLRLKLSVTSAAVTMLPANYLIDRIEFWTRAGRGKGGLIYTYFPETFVVNKQLLSEEEDKAQQALTGYVERDMHFSTKKFWRKLKIEASESRYVYIPIIGSFFDNESIFWPHVETGIRCVVHTKGSSYWLVSGTASNLSLSEADLIFEQFSISDTDFQFHEALHKSGTRRYKYLDCQEQTMNNKAMTAGSTTLFDLGLNGKFSHLAFMILPDGSPSATNSTWIDFCDLGPNSEIDVLDSKKNSAIANGVPILSDYLHKKIYVQQFGRKPIDGLYVIPFSKDIRSAYAGVMSHGWMTLNSSKNEMLSIKFDTAPTKEVHTVNLTNPGNDGGYYRLQLNNYVSASLAHNTSAANMKAFLDSVPDLADRGITTTCSGTAETDFTVTYDTTNTTDNAGKVYEYIGYPNLIVESLNDGTVEEIVAAATTASTVGVRGWTTIASGSATMAIYGFYFKELRIGPDGHLSVHDV